MSSLFGVWRSGSGSKINSTLPAVTPAEKQRSKQVEWMRKEVNGLTEIERNLLYQVQVMAGGQELSILIHLPPGFPKDPPMLNVSPPVVHSWIDEQSNIVGSPMLKNFSMHENLGKVINQVIKEFIEHPPRPAPLPTSSTDAAHTTTAHRPPPPIPRTPHHHSAKTHHNPVEIHHTHRYTVPLLPEQFPELANYSNEKLEHFLHEVEGVIEVDEYICKLPIIAKLREDRSKILEKNESQARHNLSFEPQLEKAWDELQEKFIQLQTVRDNFKKLHEEHQKYLKKYKPSKVINMLKDSVREYEQKNEQLAEDFLRKKIPVDNFLEDFLRDRQLYYLKLGKQVRLRNPHHK